MHDILIYLVLLFCSIILHFLWCRLIKAKTLQIIPFVVIALIGAYVGLCMSHSFGAVSEEINFWNIPLSASALGLYWLLVPFYLILYFNTQVESPTQRILRFVQEKGGMTLEELQKVVTNQDFVITRLSDLERCHYVIKNDDHFRLTWRGVWVARYLVVYQKILGREMGG